MPETSTPADVLLAKSFPKSASLTAVLISSNPPASFPIPLGDLSLLPPEIQSALKLLLSANHTGKPGELLSSYITLGKSPHRVCAIGVGPLPKFNAESLRRAAATLLRTARKTHTSSKTAPTPKTTDAALLLPILPPHSPPHSPADIASALTEGALLSAFDFTLFSGARKAKDLAEKRPTRIHLLASPPAATSAAQGLHHARIAALSTNFARTIASRPGNDINPLTLAAVAKDLAAETGLKFSALDEKQMKKLRMGGILGVGAGSATPPRLITLEHKPPTAKNLGKPLLIVGKSITFDTGGISIKPADKMGKMIYDKCGGMAVLGLMHALALLKTPVHVVGILTAAENHVSSTAYRPGDILTLHNGVTVEITNTDAEGRLVLADAISYGIATHKPAAVVDLATLTGGCVVALGTSMAGLFSNSDTLAAELTAAASHSGEKLWRLPVHDEHRDMLKSDLADIVNSAGRYASPLTGAAFISLALPPTNPPPWAHLDIAGPAESDKDLPYHGKGATGYGVRTLLNWVETKT